MDNVTRLLAILEDLAKYSNKERLQILGEFRKSIDNEISAISYTAPAGQIWVCGACGRIDKDRTKVGDESCFMNSVLCHEDSLAYDQRGRVNAAKAVKS